MAALRFSSSHRALNTFRAELRVEQLDPAEEEARLPKLLSLKYSCKNRGDTSQMNMGKLVVF
jgi:hypothetical protein